MPLRQSLLLALLAAAVPVLAVTGCGSSDGGSSYGSRDSAEDSPTATATTPEAPPGAAARACEGTGGVEDLRVTGVSCSDGQQVLTAWFGKPSCAAPTGGSRFSCSVDDNYRCLGTSAERGIAVSCSHPGASVSFIAKPR